MNSGKKALSDIMFWAVEAVLLAACFYLKFFLVGYITFTLCLLAVAIVVLLYRFIADYKKKNPKWSKRLKITLTSLICLGAAILFAAEIPIIMSAHSDDDPDAPYLIVLGAQVVGTQPSQSLWDRLVAAKSYLESFPESKAVVSGGKGKGEDISEAECMKNWLMSHEIPENRILMETESTSTLENIQNSLEVIRKDGGDPSGRIAIASSEYHLYRAKFIAEKLGAKPLGVAASSYERFQMCAFFVREGFGVVVSWLTI